MRLLSKYHLLTVALLVSSTSATTINVPDDYSTIQLALNAADSSDTILVQPDTYYENIFWPDVNGIKLISAGDSSNTVIDGGGVSSVIYMNPSTATIDSTTEIQGFKITNGGNIANGGGMLVSNASPTLARLWVAGNTATADGGGLYINDSSPMLTNVTVTGNTARYGGGLYIYSGTTTLTDVTVTGNTASSNGGGLFILFSSPTLMDMTVTGNTAYRGGGLSISGSPTLTDVTVTSNTATYRGGGLYIGSGNPTLTDVTVSGNTATNKGGGLYIYYYSNPTLTRVTVSRNLGEGLYFSESSGALANVTITGNTSGIYVESGSPTIAGSNIAYNGTGLYNLDNSNTIDADSVWWGHSSGPYHPDFNPSGLGDSVNGFVFIDPWLTEPDTAAPPIPVQNLRVTNQGDDFIELAWDASPIGDLAGYRIYLDTDSAGFPYADTVDVDNATAYTLSSLEPGLTYYVAATCYDTDGNESWYSREVNAPPFNSPPVEFALLAPTADTIMVRSGEAIWDTVTFSWEPALDPDGDSVFYHFESEGEFAWLFPVIDTNATTISLVPQIAVVAKGMGRDTLVITWNVAATDGLGSTWSANGPRTLSLMIDYPSATEDLPLIPQSYALHPGYPNPFNPATTIRFDLPEATEVVLTVYDLMGREVVRLVDRDMTAGYHQVIWNGRTASGREVPTGLYIARIGTPTYTRSIKLVLLK